MNFWLDKTGTLFVWGPGPSSLAKFRKKSVCFFRLDFIASAFRKWLDIDLGYNCQRTGTWLQTSWWGNLQTCQVDCNFPCFATFVLQPEVSIQLHTILVDQSSQNPRTQKNIVLLRVALKILFCFLFRAFQLGFCLCLWLLALRFRFCCCFVWPCSQLSHTGVQHSSKGFLPSTASDSSYCTCFGTTTVALTTLEKSMPNNE